jgi:hypothetical protein
VRLQVRFENYIKSPPILPQPRLPNGDPIDQGGFQTIDIKIVPESCSVTLNSYRKADEARITIPYGRLPIDPRLLRQVGVQVFMGTLTPEDFGRSIGPLYGDSQQILLPEVGEASVPLPGGLTLTETVSNEIFRGFIDDWEIAQDGDDRISLSGRDLTSILIDAEMPSAGLAGIPRSAPIDEVIRAVVAGDESAQFVPPDIREDRPRRLDGRRDIRRLQFRIAQLTSAITKTQVQAAAGQQGLEATLARYQLQLQQAQQAAVGATVAAATVDAAPVIAARYGLPAMRGIKVTNATGSPLPTLGDLKGASWFDSSGNAKRAKSGGGKDRISYWDFVTDLCVGVGLICYLRTPTNPDGSLGGLPPAEIVIDLPRTYYKEADAEIRTFTYGRNVDSITIQRSYNGRNVPTGIAVTAIEARTGQHISARYPPVAAPGTETTNRPSVNPAGLGDSAEYQTILLDDRIPGSNAQAILEQKAESLFQQISRGEMVVQVKTTSLNALPSGDGTSLPDMFQLRAGDPVGIQILPSLPEGADDGPNVMVTQAGNFWRQSTQERILYLVQVLGIDPLIASQVAIASSSDLLQKVFYVREVGIDFTAQDGFSFNIEAINYLDARWDTTLATTDLTGTQALIDSFLFPEFNE